MGSVKLLNGEKASTLRPRIVLVLVVVLVLE